jgi:hypothetical protein
MMATGYAHRMCAFVARRMPKRAKKSLLEVVAE